ncbi:MAG TPA: GNVR domain-containing protein, partial [Solirubrobacteraceae bacterium]
MLSAGVGLAYSKSATKIYEASTLVEIDPNPLQPLKGETSDLDMGAGNYWSTQEYYTTQYRLIVSERVLSKVARDLGLARDPGFMDRANDTVSPVKVAATLRKRITVEPIKSSRLVLVKVEDKDPRRAQRIADAVATAYIDQNLDTAVNSSADAVVWLGGQLDHIKKDLEHDEDALHEFKRENDLPSTSINEVSNMLRVEMQELDTALTQARTKKEELSARHAELSKVSADNPDQLPASELLGSSYLQSLRKAYQEAEAQRSALLAEGKGENHPEVKMAAGRATQAKAALLAEVTNIQGAVQRDLAIITRQEVGISSLFEATRKRAVELNMREIEYHRLDRTRDQNEKLYGMLLERMKAADLSRMMRVNNVRVVDAALEPVDPIRPRVTVNTLVGLLVGLLGGLALALVRQQLDSSIKTPGDVEHLLGSTFLGLLPAIDDEGSTKKGRRRKNKQGGVGHHTELVVHERPLAGTAEAARSIRTNLLFMNPDRPYKKILVSSAAPGE